jgi:hypothetical protein
MSLPPLPPPNNRPRKSDGELPAPHSGLIRPGCQVLFQALLVLLCPVGFAHAEHLSSNLLHGMALSDEGPPVPLSRLLRMADATRPRPRCTCMTQRHTDKQDTCTMAKHVEQQRKRLVEKLQL